MSTSTPSHPSTTSTTSPLIRITSKLIPPPPSQPSLPTFALQVTTLVNSYMLWIGTTSASASGDPLADNSAMGGFGGGEGGGGGGGGGGEEAKKAEEAVMGGCVARDWACAMPPLGNQTSAGTSLLRSSSSDVALGMAQRLARRTKKQIFLSVDVPPTFLAGGGGRTLLEVERAAVGVLGEMEGQ